MARTPLFERLPESWKYNDSKTSLVDGKGELQRYLEVWDDGFDRSEGLAESVLNTRDISRIPDRYLRLIGELVGHRWKDYRSYTWNRKRIRESISKYSYKGTAVATYDLAYEHGATYCDIIDNAQLVDVWNIQNAMFFDADFFHPGVFQLVVSDDIDLEHFLEDFEYLKAGGTKWTFVVIPSDCGANIEFIASGQPTTIPSLQVSNDDNFWWNHPPQPATIIDVNIHGTAQVMPFMGSLTFDFADPLTWGDPLSETQIYEHPLTDIDIPT